VEQIAPDSDSRGQVAIVTDGSAGIGLAIAERLSRAGASVCIVSRRQELVERAADHLPAIGSSTGARAIGVAEAIEDDGVRRTSIDRTLEELGVPQILVNNAGTTGIVASLAEADWDDVSHIWAVNQEAPLRLSMLAWDAGMRKHGGCILNIGSLAARRTRVVFGAYGVSKAALEALTRYVAIDMAPKVRVNCINSGRCSPT